ncbi:hypothetical protein [Ruania alba]|uniref:ABC-2 family transporter protein n=1 Tax=Ruania alba TaxID=648782 RepID=A0A1H5KJN4_9MICO|nr:hypothetical protein [Ruania alba]SEE65032.1 hypothetical protein SAMN04488554_2305 [Ruania alba]
MSTLLKHEFLRTRDLLTLIIGVAILLAIAGALLAATGWPVLAAVGVLLCVVVVFTLVPVLQLALAVEYWRSSYGRSGYLTHTLPVRGATVYWAKILWAWLVSLVGAAVTLGLTLAAAPAVARATGGQPAMILTSIREAWATLNEVASTWLVVAAVATLTMMILIWPVQYFFAASIGSQAPLNRWGVGGPVAVWLGVYAATQVVTFASFAAVPLAVGMDGDRLGIVRFDLFAELRAGASGTAEVMPLGFVVALLAITAVCLSWTVRSWNRKVSLT